MPDGRTYQDRNVPPSMDAPDEDNSKPMVVIGVDGPGLVNMRQCSAFSKTRDVLQVQDFVVLKLSRGGRSQYFRCQNFGRPWKL